MLLRTLQMDGRRLDVFFGNHRVTLMSLSTAFVLVATLWPFDFLRSNQAEWVARGLKFAPPSTAFVKAPEELFDVDEFSLLLEFSTGNTIQNSAVIIGYSEDFLRQNFTIAQADSFVGIRFVSKDEKVHQLWTAKPIQAFKRNVLVISYDSNLLSLFVDGRLDNDRMVDPVDLSSWDKTFPLVFASEANGSLPWDGTLYKFIFARSSCSPQEFSDLLQASAERPGFFSLSFDSSTQQTIHPIVPKGFRPFRKNSLLRHASQNIFPFFL